MSVTAAPKPLESVLDYCLKCRLEKTQENKNWAWVEIVLKWNSQLLGGTFVFCPFCQDLTNKLDKLELIRQHYLQFPQYSPFRNSVPPLPLALPSPPSIDCNSKGGPAPPDTSTGNNNTTLEDYKKLLEEAEKKYEECRKNAEVWKKSWEQEYANKMIWKDKYEDLGKEYNEVYQKEYKKLEEENLLLNRAIAERNLGIENLKEEIKKLEEENERLWKAKKPPIEELSTPCPFEWNCERKRWERDSKKLLCFAASDPINQVYYYSDEKRNDFKE